MHIDSYAYGTIAIDGKTYNKDLILFPDRIRENWWRKEGHSLSIEDLNEVLNYEPEILVVGKGDSGFMEIPALTKKALKDVGIKLIDKDTHQAVEIFNATIKTGKKVAGAFHLTC